MKYKIALVALLCALIMLLLFVCSRPPNAPAPTLAQQTSHLEDVLWYNQQLFHLEAAYISISAKHGKDMASHTAWGDVHADASGSPEIEILALEDYPPAIPFAQRQVLQNEVVMHEVLHVVLREIGVPDAAQDTIIKTLRPVMRPYVPR